MELKKFSSGDSDIRIVVNEFFLHNNNISKKINLKYPFIISQTSLATVLSSLLRGKEGFLRNYGFQFLEWGGGFF